MKTYTKKPKGPGVWSVYMNFDGQRIDSACTCLRKGYKKACRKHLYGHLAGLSAYRDCPNCLGYGFMPIPWSELNK